MNAHDAAKKILIIAAHEKIEAGGALLMALGHAIDLFKRNRLSGLILITGDLGQISQLDTLGAKFPAGFQSRIKLINTAKLGRLKAVTSLWSPMVTASVAKCLRQEKPSLIHLHKIDFAQIPVLLAIHGYRVFHTAHDFGILCPRTAAVQLKSQISCDISAGIKCNKFCHISYSSTVFYLLRLRLKFFLLSMLSVTIIAPSIALKKYLETARPRNVPVKHIRNPVEQNLAFDSHIISNAKYDSYKKRAFKIIYAGSLSRNKGAHLILEIFLKINNALRAAGITAEFFIFGQGYLEQQIKSELNSLASALNCKISGYIPHSDLMDKLRDSNIVVCPSVGQENQSGILLEAARSGCLVITSPLGGNPENFTNDFGCYYNSREIETFLSRVLVSPSTYKAAINGAMNFGQAQLTWAEHLSHLDALYYQSIQLNC
jgi:glycosyltransferase involved in cell wall biosynthesis